MHIKKTVRTRTEFAKSLSLRALQHGLRHEMGETVRRMMHDEQP